MLFTSPVVGTEYSEFSILICSTNLVGFYVPSNGHGVSRIFERLRLNDPCVLLTCPVACTILPSSTAQRSLSAFHVPSNVHGVSLVFHLHRLNVSCKPFTCPSVLSTEFHGSSIFYGSKIPVCYSLAQSRGYWISRISHPLRLNGPCMLFTCTVLSTEFHGYSIFYGSMVTVCFSLDQDFSSAVPRSPNFIRVPISEHGLQRMFNFSTTLLYLYPTMCTVNH